MDRITVIYPLEHLQNLPAAVSEIDRLIEKDSGELAMVIPCEGCCIRNREESFRPKNIWKTV
jgi:hypothetical protein